jgi:hypothetical protein
VIEVNLFLLDVCLVFVLLWTTESEKYMKSIRTIYRKIGYNAIWYIWIHRSLIPKNYGICPNKNTRIGYKSAFIIDETQIQIGSN